MKRLENLKVRYWIMAGGLVLALIALGMGIRLVSASRLEVQQAQTSPLHPTYAMLDAGGVNVLESGNPVSTMKTCGQCHDTTYIEKHSFHADLGLSDIQSGTQVSGQAWNYSNGVFGKWNPLTYRYLSQKGDALLDLGTPEWLMLYGSRVVGGGPATTSRSGLPLTDLVREPTNPEVTYLNPTSGKVALWNWVKSGVEEMDCFLCHTPNPNNAARADALAGGQFGLANTATLVGTDIVTIGATDKITWNAEAFDANGELLPEYVAIQDPTNANCAQCHGLVHTTTDPLAINSCTLDNTQTAVTGQVISGDKISESGVNLSGKDAIARSWDIHAERGLSCVDCHYSLNNPITYQESVSTKPDTLIFDPRRLDFGEYLKYPDHNFARGESAQFTVAPELKGTMRRCESCHDAQKIHADWLPYTAKHLSVVACETCHIPQMYAPAIEAYDWTVLTAEAVAASSCRGVENNGGSVTDLVTGFQPVLMMRKNVDGNSLIAPYNLVTTWFWVYDDANGNTRPVRLADLKSVYFVNGKYALEIMKAFDYDGNGQLSATELRIDTAAKNDLIVARLVALGLGNPRIVGEVQPYSINHDVAGKNYAISDCRTCHTSNSRLTQSMQLADYLPGGVMPEFVSDNNVTASGTMYQSDSALFYAPDTRADGLYIFGHSRYGWVDWIGGLFFLGVLAGVAGHGGLRIVRSLKKKKSRHEASPRALSRAVQKVYMYQAYERFWHWLQTALIVILLCTGLIIHRPDLFGGLSFRGLVVIHNVSAAILAINAAFSLFYHLTTGQIRQFLPKPYGFFEDAIEQTKYYLRGIFKHELHPFEKTPERKMNPLQQITYLGILNVLLPLQGLTGILMWGAQTWPKVADFFGGLKGLAAFHTLLAWLFGAFIIGHVYLTTTGGPKPLDSIKAMVTGWEDVEAHPEVHEEKKEEKK
jgi:thiosulfate reductase cytochrome b subunit